MGGGGEGGWLSSAKAKTPPKCVKPRFLLCVGNLIGSFQLLPKFHCFQCGEGCVKLLAINNEKYLYNSVFAAWLVTSW